MATTTRQTSNGESAPLEDAEVEAGIEAGPSGFSVDLPFMNATLTLPQIRAKVASEAQAGTRTARTGARHRGQRGGVEKTAFYGGVLALGALGVVEWPVALLVAAGTYVAQHTSARASVPSTIAAAAPSTDPRSARDRRPAARSQRTGTRA